MDSNHRQIIALIRAISGQSNVLTIPRVFIGLCHGSHRAALLLSQCVYWSDKGDADGWFFKTRDEWRREIGMNQHAVTTALKLLPWVETAVKPVRRTPKTHYKVNMAALAAAVSEHLDTERKPINDTERKPINDTERKTINLPLGKTTNQQTTNNIGGAGAPAATTDDDAELGAAIVRATRVVGSFALVKKTAKQLRAAGYSAGDIDETYIGDNSPWRRKDWRGKRGDLPTVTQIPLTIGALCAREQARAYDGLARASVAQPEQPEQPERPKTEAERVWDAIRDDIAGSVNTTVSDAWLAPTRATHYDDETGTLTLLCPSKHVAGMLNVRLINALKRCAARVTGHKQPSFKFATLEPKPRKD